MIDIRRIRDDFDETARVLARRGVTTRELAAIRELDERRRALITEGDNLRAEQREGSRRIGSAPAEERTELIAAVKVVSARLGDLEPLQADAERDLERALAVVPNLPHPEAPDGQDDTDAVELSTFGERPTFAFEPADHVELGEALGIIDIPRAVKVSGSRFTYLLGAAVLLEFALVRWGLDQLAVHGFLPVVPPVLTREEALYGTAFLPNGADQLYRMERDDLYLVGTSEVPLAGLHMNEIIERDALPLRYGGFSTCFRREAGTYGKDTRGIFRVHQFDKVEMFAFVLPEESEDEHGRLRDIEVECFKQLGLHGRVVDIPVGDLGDSAARKYDCEVWLPGQQAYRELTSASNCTDYQARRLRCRYRTADGDTAMVHTLNGTLIAVGRTLIALLENHQRADGSVAVPEVLQPYLGTEVITGHTIDAARTR
ncbi:MAG: serine--tRNA ligase [Actinobacteria bacterium]|nr:serine--tRNA ligase [Actinomycetota bacterium]